MELISADQATAGARSTPRISVIVPVFNGAMHLERCLGAILASDYANFECIVVDDASTDDSAAVARQFPVNVLVLPGEPRGPAHARNRGAVLATGDVLLFVDADVVLRPDTLGRVETALSNTGFDAVFGSYDDEPEVRDFVSQYKNLAHHLVHQQARSEGTTFWAGCGAVKRDAFVGVGGFDEGRYNCASIEDIDLGHRLHASGRRILLDRGMQVKHLKRWTLRTMTSADLFRRAVPWTQLILRGRHLPNDLNLRTSERLSALCVCVALASVVLATGLYGARFALLLLLAALELLFVGHWRSTGVAAGLASLRAEAACWALVATIGLVAALVGPVSILPLLAPVSFSLATRRWASSYPRLHGRAVATTAAVALGAATGVVLSGLPSGLLMALLASLALILALGVDFYVFLARRRGVLFALRTIPLHLLHYLVCLLGFALGAAIHFSSSVGGNVAAASQKSSS